jgi:hypothetical protein
MLNLLNRPKDQFLGCFWAEFARPVSFQPFLNESTAQIMLPWYIMSTKPKPNPSSSRGRTLPLLPRRPQARYGPPELRPLLLSLLLASGGGSSLLPFQLPLPRSGQTGPGSLGAPASARAQWFWADGDGGSREIARVTSSFPSIHRFPLGLLSNRLPLGLLVVPHLCRLPSVCAPRWLLRRRCSGRGWGGRAMPSRPWRTRAPIRSNSG